MGVPHIAVLHALPPIIQLMVIQYNTHTYIHTHTSCTADIIYYIPLSSYTIYCTVVTLVGVEKVLHEILIQISSCVFYFLRSHTMTALTIRVST